jgi:hypothetical protein
MNLLQKPILFKRKKQPHAHNAVVLRDKEQPAPEQAVTVLDEMVDSKKRLFLKGLAVIVIGVFATTFFPKKADALVLGSSPNTSTIGIKNAANARVNPATNEGNSVSKKTIVLSGSGTVHAPSSGKRLRLYTSKFSLDATMTSISFRFTSGGTDFEKYLAPRTGGLYGTNNHPNFVEGGVNEVLYCDISGTGNVQVNIDYLEV